MGHLDFFFHVRNMKERLCCRAQSDLSLGCMKIWLTRSKLKGKCSQQVVASENKRRPHITYHPKQLLNESYICSNKFLIKRKSTKGYPKTLKWFKRTEMDDVLQKSPSGLSVPFSNFDSNSCSLKLHSIKETFGIWSILWKAIEIFTKRLKSFTFFLTIKKKKKKQSIFLTFYPLSTTCWSYMVSVIT